VFRSKIKYTTSGGDPELVPGQEQTQRFRDRLSGQEVEGRYIPSVTRDPQIVQPVPFSQIRPTIRFLMEVAVQGMPIQAVMDTKAEMNVLSKGVYDELDQMPPIKQCVTMT
jgi:hypothetical protein